MIIFKDEKYWGDGVEFWEFFLDRVGLRCLSEDVKDVVGYLNLKFRSNFWLNMLIWVLLVYRWYL